MYTSHRNGHSTGGSVSNFKAFGGPKQSTGKYKLYADGTIFDQELKRVVGYVSDVDIEKAYRMHDPALQKYLREYLLA